MSAGQTIIDTDAVDVAPIVTTVEAFIVQHQEYADFVSGPGRRSNVAPSLGFEVIRSAWAVDLAMKTAGLTNSTLRGTDSEKVNGLSILILGVNRFLKSIPERVVGRGPDGDEKMVMLDAGKTLKFDPVAIAEIHQAGRHLARSNQAKGEVAGAGGKKPKGRRGRLPHTDTVADRRIAEAWASGNFPTYEELARELNMKTRVVKLALERHRNRQRRNGAHRPG